MLDEHLSPARDGSTFGPLDLVAGGRSAGGGVRPPPSVDVLNLSSVRRERVSATTGAVSALSPAADPERVVALRGALRARVQTTYDVVDNLGHVRQQTVYGHVADSGWVGPTDEPTVSVSVPVAICPPGGWCLSPRGVVSDLYVSASWFERCADLGASVDSGIARLFVLEPSSQTSWGSV